MTRKITLGLLVVGSVFFMGCGGGSSDTKKTDSSVEETETTTKSDCTVSGNTVLVDEGKTCTNNGDTLSCANNRVTLNGSITAKTIKINGKMYTCQ